MTSASALSSRCESAPSMASISPISSKRAIKSRRSSCVGPGLSLLVARSGSGVFVSITVVAFSVASRLGFDLGGFRHLLPLLHLSLEDVLKLLRRRPGRRHTDGVEPRRHGGLPDRVVDDLIEPVDDLLRRAARRQKPDPLH